MPRDSGVIWMIETLVFFRDSLTKLHARKSKVILVIWIFPIKWLRSRKRAQHQQNTTSTWHIE